MTLAGGLADREACGGETGGGGGESGRPPLRGRASGEGAAPGSREVRGGRADREPHRGGSAGRGARGRHPVGEPEGEPGRDGRCGVVVLSAGELGGAK